jgi:hypothetical protein
MRALAHWLIVLTVIAGPWILILGGLAIAWR